MVIKMGKLNVKVQDGIDTRFREEIFKRKGMKKGNLTKALEEAILLWINVNASEKQTTTNSRK